MSKYLAKLAADLKDLYTQCATDMAAKTELRSKAQSFIEAAFPNLTPGCLYIKAQNDTTEYMLITAVGVSSSSIRFKSNSTLDPSKLGVCGNFYKWVFIGKAVDPVCEKSISTFSAHDFDLTLKGFEHIDKLGRRGNLSVTELCGIAKIVVQNHRGGQLKGT